MRRRALAVAAGAALLLAVVPAVAVSEEAESEEGQEAEGDGGEAESDCFPAGAADLPFRTTPEVAATEPDLVLNGGGWGHGVGMSQYGARGAALLGCTSEEIVTTYFTGVEVEQRDLPPDIRVGLFPYAPPGRAGSGDVTVINVRNLSGEILHWRLDGQPFADQPATTSSGDPTTWTVRTLGDGSLRLSDGDVTVAEGGGVSSRLSAALDGKMIQLTSKARRYRWGTLEFTSRGPSAMWVVIDIPSIETYLYGLAEMPSSWPEEALASQAVVGRSYATTARIRGAKAHCNCHLYDSVWDQVYAGYEKEGEGSSGQWGARWVAAVDGTAGRVMSHEEAVVQGFYSSSHGGWSEDVEHVWGTAIAYLKAVDTSRWETAEGANNPFQRWSAGFTTEQLAQRFGLASFESFEIVDRGPGGRATTVGGALGAVVTGRDADGEAVERSYSGERLRSVLGLRSGLFHAGDAEGFVAFEVTNRRLAGDDRILTAVDVARYGWEEADAVVLARSDHPADALAGSGLAGALGAPLLITPSAGLHPAVAEELERLGTTRVYLLGGEAALSAQVEEDLAAAGIVDVERMDGATRFETAAMIADVLDPAPGGRALLVRGQFPEHPGREWPDALAVAGLAARRAAAGDPWPILVVTDTVPEATRDALARLGTARVSIAGGPATVPDEVVEELTLLGLEVDRLAGDDRWGTSRAVATIDEGSGQILVVATGTNFPDGLAAGPLAARVGGRLLLVPSTYEAAGIPWLEGQHPDWVAALGWTTPKLFVIGGPVAVAPDVADAIRDLLQGGAGSTTSDTSGGEPEGDEEGDSGGDEEDGDPEGDPGGDGEGGSDGDGEGDPDGQPAD